MNEGSNDSMTHLRTDLAFAHLQFAIYYEQHFCFFSELRYVILVDEINFLLLFGLLIS